MFMQFAFLFGVKVAFTFVGEPFKPILVVSESGRLAKDGFGLAHGRRTPEFSTQPFDERSFLSIIGMAVKNAYSQVMTPEDALNYAQKRYDEQFLHTGP